MGMSMFTIQCRLCASEQTRRYFWESMEKYILLVNELLEKIAQNSQFQEWQKKGADGGKRHKAYGFQAQAEVLLS